MTIKNNVKKTNESKFKATVRWLFDASDWKRLLRSIPSIVVTLFCTSVLVMNLMANKIILNCKIIAADGGFLLSWIPFLCMDVITKRYGPKASTKLNILALMINLLFVIVFAFIAAIQIDIGSNYQQGSTYSAFNSVFSCNWFVLLGSSIAFLISGIINNFLNWTVGKMFKKNPNGKLAYFTRSYVSTLVGQFVDNLLFSVIVFIIFAPIYWGYSITFVQSIGAAVSGTILEFIMEALFSPIGYNLSKKWEEEGVGSEYLQHNNIG